MSKDSSSFEDLEKQLAKDTLEKALQNLHGEITREIEKNKTAFSEEIRRTLEEFKEDLEESVMHEMDKNLSSLFEKHFKDTSLQIKESFDKMFSPVLEEAKEDMQRLHIQGEDTLHAWKEMMKPYANLWNRPFFIILLTSVLVASLTSVFSSFLLVRDDRNARKWCESDLRQCESDLQSYTKQYFEIKEAMNGKTSNSQVNTKINNKKK